MRIDLEDGKYTYLLDDLGGQQALRYGEPWRDLTGDKFIYCLAEMVTALRAENERLTKKVTDQACDKGLLRIEVEELTRQRDEAIAALRPFAALIADHHDRMPDDQPLFFINSNGFTVGDLRKANAAIKGVQL